MICLLYYIVYTSVGVCVCGYICVLAFLWCLYWIPFQWFDDYSCLFGNVSIDILAHNGISSWHNGYATRLPCSWPQFKLRTWWLKFTPGMCACVPKIPRGEWRRRDCSVAIPPGGDFLLSVSLSLSVCWWAHVPYSKKIK